MQGLHLNLRESAEPSFMRYENSTWLALRVALIFSGQTEGPGYDKDTKWYQISLFFFPYFLATAIPIIIQKRILASLKIDDLRFSKYKNLRKSSSKIV